MTRTGEREIGAVSGRVGMYAEILCWNDPKNGVLFTFQLDFRKLFCNKKC